MRLHNPVTEKNIPKWPSCIPTERHIKFRSAFFSSRLRFYLSHDLAILSMPPSISVGAGRGAQPSGRGNEVPTGGVSRKPLAKRQVFAGQA